MAGARGANDIARPEPAGAVSTHTISATAITCIAPTQKLGSDKPVQRVSEERVGLVRAAIPLAVLVADYLHRDHDAAGAEIAVWPDRCIDKLPKGYAVKMKGAE
jgi:hypothetical protein